MGVAEYHRIWYAKNRDKRIKQIRACNDRLKERNRQFVFEYLNSHPCVDCGEDDPIVLEFDHVRGKKYLDVCIVSRWGASLKKLQSEIDKCEVRCCNCHRRVTVLRRSLKKPC